MKHLLLLVLSVWTPFRYSAQNTASETEKTIVISDSVINITPEFPGGKAAMFMFIQQELEYPAEALDKGIQGNVFVQFTIGIDGFVQDIELLRGLGGGCDEEAMRVVAKMPAWEPGTTNGKPVPVKYTLPFSFKIGKKAKRNKKKGSTDSNK